MLTKGDKLLILIIIVVSMILTAYFARSFRAYGDKTLIIKVDGQAYKSIKLDEKIKDEILVETEFGYNLIEINKGRVRVKEASCPDELDVKQGSISKVGQMIVCLPNRLTIEIEGSKTDDDIDRLSR